MLRRPVVQSTAWHSNDRMDKPMKWKEQVMSNMGKWHGRAAAQRKEKKASERMIIYVMGRFRAGMRIYENGKD